MWVCVCLCLCAGQTVKPSSAFLLIGPAATVSVCILALCFFTHTHTHAHTHTHTHTHTGAYIKQGSAEEKNQRAARRSESKHYTQLRDPELTRLPQFVNEILWREIVIDTLCGYCFVFPPLCWVFRLFTFIQPLFKSRINRGTASFFFFVLSRADVKQNKWANNTVKSSFVGEQSRLCGSNVCCKRFPVMVTEPSIWTG